MTLPIVYFLTQRFSEIQAQDNPAFGDDECVMVCLCYKEEVGLYKIMHIKPDPIESVNHKAITWEISLTAKIAELISEGGL